MIIDSHTHLSGPPFNEETLYATYPDGGAFDMGIERAACHVDLLLEDMEERGVERSLVMGFPEMITNEQLSDLVKKHPDKITGFAGVRDPKSEDSIRELDHSVKELGLRGLKLHPDCHSFSPSDREIVPLIKCAAELDVPTLIHSYPGGMRRGYFGTAAPDTIDEDTGSVGPDNNCIAGLQHYIGDFGALVGVGSSAGPCQRIARSAVGGVINTAIDGPVCVAAFSLAGVGCVVEAEIDQQVIGSVIFKRRREHEFHPAGGADGFVTLINGGPAGGLP